MKFLIVSKEADTLALAIRLQDEGNEVEFYCAHPKRKHVGKGLVKLVDNFQKHLERDKIIVFDMSGYGKIADKLKKAGYPVFGGSSVADRMELDRYFFSQLLKTAGVHIPRTYKFTSFKEAIKFVENTKQRYVFKPHQNMNTALTYVSTNYEEMIYFLEHESRQIHRKIEFELQLYIEGIEVDCEVWFNKGEPVEPFNITFERKKELTGDLGRNTGSQINIVKVIPGEFPLYRQTLKKLIPFLKEVEYTGPLDVNFIVSGGTPYGLEASPRLGYDAFWCLTELLKQDVGKLISDCALGQLKRIDLDIDSFAGGVRCSVPKEPYIPHRLIQNIKNFKHIHLYDAMIDKWGSLVCADTDFIIACVTSKGPTIQETSRRVYYLLQEKLKNFNISDLEYRTDLGVQAKAYYTKLKNWGLI